MSESESEPPPEGRRSRTADGPSNDGEGHAKAERMSIREQTMIEEHPPT